ncbi:MAG: endonuclease domain-containing protein [Chloroflexi bacterium]|nr:endonuclease domain-containing protein [Chloroflexota bacterium]
MKLKLFQRADCILIRSGEGWPNDNRRPGINPPENFGAMSIGYRVRVGSQRSVVFILGKHREYLVNNEDIEAFDPTTSGPRTDPKICLSCHRLKNLSEFPLNQNNRRGPITRPRCKECYVLESGPPLSNRVKESFKESVGAPDQGDCWQCPVCRKITIANVTANLVVDHDQERRQPRGIICDSCNTGLGRFKNGENHLQNALDYLQEYESRN